MVSVAITPVQMGSITTAGWGTLTNDDYAGAALVVRYRPLAIRLLYVELGLHSRANELACV